MSARRAILAATVASLSLTWATALGTTPSGAAAPDRSRCTITGTAGADRLVGTPGNDVICGRGGNDVLVGRSGNDVLVGGDGKDVLQGGPGQDSTTGGSGADELRGGDGKDVLAGGPGGDDLDGGPRRDQVDGGTGDNFCTLDAADVATRCTYDRDAPVASAPLLSALEVDVTSGAQSVTVTVRVTDDTGVEYVIVGPGPETPWYPDAAAERTSGGVRDGVWTATIEFSRWARPGVFRPTISMHDRVDRTRATSFDELALTVRNDDPDLEGPEMELLGPVPTRVFDVRTSGVTVPVRVHMTDVGSGVDPEAVNIILWAPRSNGQQTLGLSGGRLELASGTRRDGIWDGRVEVPEDSLSGTYNFAIFTGDMSMRGTSSRIIYWSETEYRYAYYNDYWEHRQLPNGMGGVEILGRPRTDSTPPAVIGLEVSPSTVDTLGAPASVVVTTDAADSGRGVGGLHVALRPVNDASWDAPSYSAVLTLQTGTIRQGTWTGTITLPRGASPGRYVVQVHAWDRDQNEISYVSASDPHGSGGHLLDTDPIVTVLDSSLPVAP